MSLEADASAAFADVPTVVVHDGPTPRMPEDAAPDDEVVLAWQRDGWECADCGRFVRTADYAGLRGCPDCSVVGPNGTIEWADTMAKVEEPAATARLGDQRGAEREVTVDFVDGVTVTETTDPALGAIEEVAVSTTVARHEWGGQHSQAIFDVLESVGVDRPTDSKRHGVKFDGGDVTVTAYRRTGAVETDGGAFSVVVVDAVQYLGVVVPPFVAMSRILTDLGEEWYGETDLTGVASVNSSLYNDGTDSVADTDDIGDLTTEPGGGSFARQTTEISFEDLSGDWGIDSDNQESFDTSDSTQSVDSYLFETSFQADDTGDGTSTVHLLLTGALSQTYDLSSVDTLNINAGTAGVTVS